MPCFRLLTGTALLTATAICAGTVAAATAPTASSSATPGADASDCPASRVHYQRNSDAGSGLTELPWIAGGSGPRRIVGYLFYYGTSVMGDRRFNASSGVAIPVGGEIRAGDGSPVATTKILWVPRRDGGNRLSVQGSRLDGPGAFRQTFRAVSGGAFPSAIALPSAGCWRLTLKTGRLEATVVFQAVELHARPVCEPTLVRHDWNPRLGADRWLELNPSSSGLTALGSFSPDPEAIEASIYPGSFYPGGRGTKVLWVPTKADRAGSSLAIIGRRIDGSGLFRQEEPEAFGTSPPLLGPVFPSIIDIPAPGCWLLTLRTGRTAGITVLRALEPG